MTRILGNLPFALIAATVVFAVHRNASSRARFQARFIFMEILHGPKMWK